MIYLGIDPGLGGAVAMLGPQGGAAYVWDTPIDTVMKGGKQRRDYLLADMRRILAQEVYSPQAGRFDYRRELVLCALEYVGPMPDQGVSSMFRMGRGLGLWEGILAGLAIPFVKVSPVTWKRSYNLLGQGKQESRIRAQQRFPTVDVSKKRHDGRADALWLALFAQEHLGEKRQHGDSVRLSSQHEPA